MWPRWQARPASGSRRSSRIPKQSAPFEPFEAATSSSPPARTLSAGSSAPRFRNHAATTVPMLVSSSLHAVVLIALLVIGSLGFTAADERTEVIEPASEPVRLVYVPRFGPGGGGGGGGLKMPNASTQGSTSRTPEGEQPDPGATDPAAGSAGAASTGTASTSA